MENSTTSNSIGEGNTHVWVSARHGDLSEWAPYSGLELNIPVLPPIASAILIKYFVTILHKNKLFFFKLNGLVHIFMFNLQGLAPKKMHLDPNTESGRI